MVDHGISNLSVSAGQTLTFTIPKDAFLSSTSDVQLTFKATLANGAPLPNWLHFNPTTGTFSGVAPAGENGDLHIKVNAIDNKGNEAVTTFTVKSGKATGDGDDQAPKAPKAPPQRDGALSGKDLLAALGFNGYGLPDDGVEITYNFDAQQAASAEIEAGATDHAALEGEAQAEADSATDGQASHAQHLSAQLQREAQRFGQARAATLRHLAVVEQARRI